MKPELFGSTWMPTVTMNDLLIRRSMGDLMIFFRDASEPRGHKWPCCKRDTYQTRLRRDIFRYFLGSAIKKEELSFRLLFPVKEFFALHSDLLLKGLTKEWPSFSAENLLNIFPERSRNLKPWLVPMWGAGARIRRHGQELWWIDSKVRAVVRTCWVHLGSKYSHIV